ncbi:MAG: DUF933 domain-containing protein [Candidatus Margulisbacteria bacterium]|nr:DUF933 domain-containing protein [Candidatus Margulisiibacteriota bacterium]
MKVVIIGLPQAGQQQLYSLLTGISVDTIQQKPMEAQQGICEVRDPRITKLIEIYKPKKSTYAKIEYLLLPDFTLTGPTKELVFNQLKNADEICWVARAESAESDVANFVSELVIHDIMLVEKRLETIAKDQKKKFSDQKEKEQQLIEMCKQQLDKEKPLKDLKFAADQLKELRAYQFFTLKPVFLVINVPEAQIKDSSIAQKISASTGYPCIQLSAELEAEIAQLPAGERAEFMKELGIDEPALNKMTRIAYAELGLISYFTVGEDEVRAWTVRKGAAAPEAGSVIHSDIEKGFVRAEMFKYDDLLSAGSEAKLKELGKMYLKGRDYLVEDGDILSFRFNV